jgi:hypothetical protein
MSELAVAALSLIPLCGLLGYCIGRDHERARIEKQKLEQRVRDLEDRVTSGGRA